MERHFDEELSILREKLLVTSALVEEALNKSIRAIAERSREIADQVIMFDDKIDKAEIEVDEYCIRLFALRQPEARDLRFVISALRINNELERIGDQAVNIAERAVDLSVFTYSKTIGDILKMAEIVKKMLKDSINAFVVLDSDLAWSVCKRDNLIDTLNIEIFRELLKSINTFPQYGEREVDLISVGKYLERIGDHATNISENVIYIVQGKIIRHSHYDEVE